jgi:hypothetical protein
MKLLSVLLLSAPLVAALIEDGIAPLQPEAHVDAVVTTLNEEDRDLVRVPGVLSCPDRT